MIDDEISMRGPSQNIHWNIEHIYGIAKVQARTRKQAKEFICECIDVLEWIE